MWHSCHPHEANVLRGELWVTLFSYPTLFQGCCSEAEAQQTGRRQTPPQPMQCELPTVPVQIGSNFLKGVSFNESAADNLKLKTVAFLGVPTTGCELENRVLKET